MKKRKSDNSALSVLKRITQQETLLAQAELFESMSKLRRAEMEQASLVKRLDQHHASLAESWRVRAMQGLRNSLSTAPYRSWLKGEIVDANANVETLNSTADAAKDREAELRAEGRVLDEVISRRSARDAQEIERRVLKETDEMVLLRSKRESNDNK